MVLFRTEHTSEEGVTKGKDVSALITSTVEQNSDLSNADSTNNEKSLSRGM